MSTTLNELREDVDKSKKEIGDILLKLCEKHNVTISDLDAIFHSRMLISGKEIYWVDVDFKVEV